MVHVLDADPQTALFCYHLIHKCAPKTENNVLFSQCFVCEMLYDVLNKLCPLYCHYIAINFTVGAKC